MKTFNKFIVSFCFFLAACSSTCAEPRPEIVPNRPQPSASASNLSLELDSGLVGPDARVEVEIKSEVSIGEAKFSLPVTFEKIENNDYDFVAINQDKSLLLAFKATNFDSTYEHFVLSNVRTLRNDRVEILDIDNTEINGINFSFVKSQRNDLHSWHFYTFKNGKGYEFNCGGSDSVDLQQPCMEIFKTIRF